MSAVEGLPPGWSTAVDPCYGMPYYFNVSTGQRTWEQPSGASELPHGWAQARDPRSGLPYYYNASTGQRSWEKPDAGMASAC